MLFSIIFICFFFYRNKSLFSIGKYCLFYTITVVILNKKYSCKYYLQELIGTQQVSFCGVIQFEQQR